MPNPLVPQGVVNRLIASVVIRDYPGLNITVPYIGAEGIRFSLDGNTSLAIPTMTGVVQSPEPFQMATISIPVLRTQNIANLYKLQMELFSLIGPVTLRPDVTTVSPYYLENCAIAGVGEQSFDGRNPVVPITITGQYYLNSSLWTG